MKDLKRKCYQGAMPGIKKLWYVHVDEVDSVTITAEETATVTLKTGGSWGEIHGKRMTADSDWDRRYTNRITALLPGWTIQEAVGIGRLVHGRYLVKFTDRAGDIWLCGYGEPLHLNVSKTAPETPQQYQGLELVFSCESEFGFLKTV